MFVHTLPLCLKTLRVVFAALCSAFEPVHLHLVGLSGAHRVDACPPGRGAFTGLERDSAENFSFLFLRSFLLFLLPSFPHPLLPCLVNEARGKFILHFFDNVITTIIIMIVLMMIIHMVKIKGGESERAGSGLGGGDVCSVISGLRRQTRRHTRV